MCDDVSLVLTQLHWLQVHTLASQSHGRRDATNLVSYASLTSSAADCIKDKDGICAAITQHCFSDGVSVVYIRSRRVW